MRPLQIHFFASGRPEAQHALKRLRDQYGQADLSTANYVVTIGGDGTTLQALHMAMPAGGTAIFAMRVGSSVGFLGNRFCVDGLRERLETAQIITFHPLRAAICDIHGTTFIALGFNEIAVMRQARQAAKLRILIDGAERIANFAGDGVLVATAIGSMAYNRSAGGPALAFDSGLLALTGLAPCRTAEWSNVVLSDQTVFDIEVHEPKYRSVRVDVGLEQIFEATHIRIAMASEFSSTLLLDRDSVRRPLNLRP
jgi:NAD+ kinase